MSDQHEKTPPQVCGRCGNVQTEWHCDNAQCTWVKCANCKGLTDVTRLIGQGES